MTLRKTYIPQFDDNVRFQTTSLFEWYSVILVTEKPKKILLCLKIIKWFFSIFFSRIQQSFYSKCNKTRKEKLGNGFLFSFCV